MDLSKAEELAKRLEMIDEESMYQQPATTREICEAAAALIREQVREIADIDSILPELVNRYHTECNYCGGQWRVCDRVPEGHCLLRDPKYLRHASRTQARGGGK